MTTRTKQQQALSKARVPRSLQMGCAALIWLAVIFPVSGALAQEATTERAPPEIVGQSLPSVMNPQTPLGLPNQRPKLTLSMPITSRLLGLEQATAAPTESDAPNRVSLSLEAWQLNTASLAHIQCAEHTLTLDTFLAQNCQFVDQPVPDNAVNLVQVQGEWTAAPNLKVGLGLFRSENDRSALSAQLGQPLDQIANLFGVPTAGAPTPAGVVEGAQANVSFGIEVDQVGDFLLGLQVARYRQRTSLMDLGDPREWAAAGRFDESITQAAQLNLAWQRGNFRGDLVGRYVDEPIRLGQFGNQTITAPASGFDLEFSWRPGSASFAIGVSNVLDQSHPNAHAGSEGHTDEGVRDIYGRIPYVRYKQDL